MAVLRFLLLLLLPLITIAPADAQPPARKPAAARPDPSVVERQLTEAARRSPDSFDAHHALGEFYLQHRRVAEAIPHLERAQSLDASHYVNAYDLALAYLETGQLDTARRQVERLLKVKETGELLNLLGDVEARAGNFVTAAEFYQRAARLEPTEDHLFDWGNNLLQLRAYDEAIEVFTPSIRRHPKSARLHVGLGIAQYSRGQYDAAAAAFMRASDLAPSDPRPIQFLGEMYGVAPQRTAEITRRLARFVARQPRDAPGHYYYAMNVWKGDASGASSPDLTLVERHLRRAVTLDPKLAKAWLQLGVLLSESRRWPEAIRALETATRLQPDVAQAHFRLAQAYRLTGQQELARKSLATFEQLKAREADSPTPAPRPRN